MILGAFNPQTLTDLTAKNENDLKKWYIKRSKLQRPQMNKSKVWSELKSIGNPDKIKWTSSVATMFESIQNQALLQQLQTYSNFEPFFISKAKHYFKPEYQLLSDLLKQSMKTLRGNQDFPVEWGYEVPESEYDYAKNRSMAGEIIKYRADSLRSLENQISALKNKGSDFMDFDVDKHKFFFTKNFQPVYVPRPNRVRKSKTGKGNDFQNCNVIDDEFIYCPPSEKCLLDCLSYGKTLSSEVQENILKFLKSKKVFRFNIAQCYVSDIAQIIGVKFNIYRQKKQKLRYPYEEDQIILCLLESHWIILKKYDSLSKCFQYAQENIIWTEKLIADCQFDIGYQTPKYYDCLDCSAFADTWIQDFEAYPDCVSGKFIPYASGFVKLEDIQRFQQGKSLVDDPKKYCYQTDDSDCIIQMLTIIDKQTKKISKEVPSGKPNIMKKVNQKRDVYIYAHNSANFDSYFYLEVKGVECKNMVEKGGIMSMTIGGEQFKNCNFIIRDTRKFLNSSLAKLCKSFKIPEEYCKTSMNHDEVNALTWKDLKHIWSPYLDLDVISLSLIWIQFVEKMRLVSKNIDVKKYCSIAQLSYSIVCKDQKLPFFVDPQLRKFIQRANRGGRVIARNQYFQTENLEKILELNNCTNIDQLVGKQLTPESVKLIGEYYQIAFDATSLYPSAMCLPHATYLDAENCFPLNQEDCQNFNPEEYKAKKFIIECDLYAPGHLQFVPLSIKTEYGAQFSTGNLRNVVVNDVDLFECFRFGYELKSVHQGVWSKPVKYDFIKDFVLTFFNERAKVKNIDAVLGDLYKLILNSAYGKFGQKPCDTKIKFTTKKEMENEGLYTDDVLECIELGNGQICYKTKVDQQEGKTMSPHHIAGYILSYSKQIMNNFVLLLGADKENLISYMDTDSFYIHAKDFDKLKHIKDELGGGKNDYGESKKIIKADYLGCKSKVCYVFDSKDMSLSKKVTWKGISQTKFEQIDQKSLEIIKKCDDINNVYKIHDIDNWSKSKKLGVSIQHGCSKKLSIEEYCQKYDLVDQVYHFKHLE